MKQEKDKNYESIHPKIVVFQGKDRMCKLIGENWYEYNPYDTTGDFNTIFPSVFCKQGEESSSRACSSMDF